MGWSGHESHKKWSDVGFILKVEGAGLSDKFEVRKGQKSGMTPTLWPQQADEMVQVTETRKRFGGKGENDENQDFYFAQII